MAEQLRDEIARVLRREVTDPRVGLVTLTRLDVAPDLSSALVFWSTLGDDEAAVEAAGAGLASAASFIRRRLAKTLPLRRVPELRFRYDPSMVLAQRTLSAIQELDDDEKA